MSAQGLRIFFSARTYNVGIGQGVGSIKTVIYLDILLLVNFLAAYFLLLAAGGLCAQRPPFGRLLAGSAAAALSALILLAPPLPLAVQLGYKLGTAAVVTSAAFGVRSKRRWLAVTAVYAALNIALGGLAVLGAMYSQAPTLQAGNLTLYLRISPVLLLVLAGVLAAGAEIFQRFFCSAAPAVQTVGLQTELCGHTLRLRAAADTANHLKDPVTCLPVLVVSYPDARARLPTDVCAFLDAWFSGSTRRAPPAGAHLRLIPWSTAAGSGLLPGFAVSGISLISDTGLLGLGRTALAFTQTSFGSSEYEALYGPDFL